MPEVARSRHAMIAGMSPQLRGGAFVFASLASTEVTSDLLARALATFHEDEGLSVILDRDVAEAAGLDDAQPMACITLNVYSALDGVGLTAAVATALAEEGIPCNMVAAYHHDHAFVPAADSDRAMQVLLALQNGATGI